MSASAATSVHIVATGGLCALGLDMTAIVAAVRGRLTGFALQDHLPARRDGRPLTLALLPDAVAGTDYHDPVGRMLAMALAPAKACLGAARGAFGPDTPPLPFLLSLPSPRPGFGAAEATRCAALLATRLPCRFDPALSGITCTGQPGGLAALITGAALIRAGRAEACLIGGLEAVDVAMLDWLDTHRQLKAEDVPCGLIPGEAAGFVLLASDGFMCRHGLTRAVQLTAGATAAEPSPWYGGQPATGAGLSQVLGGLLTPEAPHAEGPRADVTFIDHNGQNWRAEEWLTAWLRHAPRLADPLDLRHPADGWGDIGAATGLLLVALAAAELCHPWASPGHKAHGQTALVACAAQLGPERAGVLLHRPPPPEGRQTTRPPHPTGDAA